MRPVSPIAIAAAPMLGLAAPASAQLLNQTSADYVVSASASPDYADQDTSTTLGTLNLGVGQSISFGYAAGAQISVSTDSQPNRVTGLINGLAISRSFADFTCGYDIDFVFGFNLSAPAALTFGTGLNGWRIQDLGASAVELNMSLLDNGGALLGFLEAPVGVVSVDTITLNLSAGDYTLVIDTFSIVPPNGGGQTAAESLCYYELKANAPQPCSPADTNTTNTNPGDDFFGMPDGQVDGADLSYYVENWLGQNLAVADVNTTNTNPGEAGYGEPDGQVDGADLSYFVEQWLLGCA